MRTTKRVENEEEEEEEEEAGRGETRQRRVIDPEKGSSAVGPVRCSSSGSSSGGLQQPSTPGFSSFYTNQPSPDQLTLTPSANKGLGAGLKGSLAGNRD